MCQVAFLAACALGTFIYPASTNIVSDCDKMTVKVEMHRKNPLLKRDEAIIVINHAGKPTPKRAEIIDDAAKALKADKELVIIDEMFSKEGVASTRARIYAYHKKEDMPASKVQKMMRRMGLLKKEEAASA